MQSDGIVLPGRRRCALVGNNLLGWRDGRDPYLRGTALLAERDTVFDGSAALMAGMFH